MKLELKTKAIHLRKEGKTYSEIRTLIGPVPKGTLSNWLKGVELTELQKKQILRRMLDKAAIGRQKAGWTNHQKRLKRIATIQSEAEKEFPALLKEPLFLIGLVLYLAEGSRKYERFQFMNSDPYLVKIIIKWLKIVGKIRNKEIRARLYLHRAYANENCERFWAGFLKIPPKQFLKTVYKPTLHRIKKNPKYMGCIRIETIGGNKLFWKILKWRDILYKSLEKSSRPSWYNWTTH